MCILWGPTTVHSADMNEDAISGVRAVALQSALAELAKRNLKASDYKVSVIATASSVIVSFTDPNAPRGQRGATPGKPGFEVELTTDAKSIVRANFVR
jgi:hypothetical protein